MYCKIANDSFICSFLCYLFVKLHEEKNIHFQRKIIVFCSVGCVVAWCRICFETTENIAYSETAKAFLFLFLLSLQMDPIQKAVINHTFGVPLPHRRKQIISCNICQLRFNSDVSRSFCIRAEISTYLLGCAIICINWT